MVIDEPTTAVCRCIWDDADRRLTSRLTYVEESIDVVEVTPELTAAAADLARSMALRGYDAVHCASAAWLRGSELLSASGDSQLLEAWRRLGVTVVDTHRHLTDQDTS